VGANVYSFVGEKTGDTIRANPSPYYYNASYPGIMNSKKYAPQPVPNISLVHNGRAVLPAIQAEWKDMQSKTYYTDSIVTPDGAHPPPS
jgi:acid phosphatase